MSRGKNLQEMEVGTAQSKTAVNAGAKPAEAMDTSIAGSYEDLGGPTPENYKTDDDSAKLKTPGATLKQVKDVVTKGAKAAEPMKGMKEEEESTEETIEETQEVTDEVVEEAVEEIDIEEDVNALLGGEELSEEFREKAKMIFEAALKSKVAQVTATIEEQHAAKLAEEVAEAKEALSERVDSYLEYVSDEWFQENSLVIEHALKAEMTESFLTGLKGLFEEHYVSIPEDKYDVLESMVEKLDDMETKLNEQIDKNISLNKRLAESVADGILDQVSEGLAVTQKEKLASLSESVEFESEETYREKLETLKESYFSEKAVSPESNKETLSEGVDNAAPETYSNSMSRYLRTLGSTLQS
ncbi:MAG: T4 prohead core scaffold protein [Euryarchaeota archaeon]|nr:T4 prohead core scaffold protein [Euryarchaeota archaeon]